MTYIYKTPSVSLKKVAKNWELIVEWEGPKRRFWINFPFPLLKIIKQKKVGDMTGADNKTLINLVETLSTQK